MENPVFITRKQSALAILLALFLTAFLSFAACSAAPSGSGPSSTSADTNAVGENDTWSVFVYMCGSNLETQAGFATANIVELQSVSLPSSVNFIIETGGANEWQNDVMNASYLERYEFRNGQFFLQQQLSRVSMGDASTFSDFLTWGVENYPADHYMLVFWDHGGGSLSGVCQDELDHDTLTLPEIRSGLAAAGVTFDIVGFDTCLMATLETAQILAPYANYMVASEEVEPACGWAWAEWPAWFANPSDGVIGLGTRICDSYFAKCQANRVGSTVTLSVVDLSGIGAVADNFELAARDMAQSTESPGRMQHLEQEGHDVRSYGHANYLEGYTDMVDLSDLMRCMDDSLSNAEAVRQAIDQAVVYEVHGFQSAKSTGLSVFYPLKIDVDTFVKYFELSTENDLDNIPYLQFLAVEAGAYDMVNWVDEGVQGLDPVGPSDAADAFSVTSSISSDGRYVVDITGNTEWIADVTRCSVGQLLDDGTVVMLGSTNDLDLAIDPNTGAVRYTDRFDGGWFKIGDAYVYADIVDMVAEGDNPSYNLYSTPVEWTTTNSRGKTLTVRTNLLSMYDYETNSYSVICVYDDAEEDGMSGKSAAALSPGDRLKFLVSRNVNGQVVNGSTGSITWSSDTKMTYAFAGEATYVYMVTITDLFGNEFVPDPALITFSGGKRTAKLVSLNQL